MKILTYTSFLAIIVLFAELINLRRFIAPIVVLGLLAIAAVSYPELSSAPQFFFNNMLLSDRYSTAFSFLLIFITILTILLSVRFYRDQSEKYSDYVAIKLFALAGAIAMVSFSNLTMFFIGLEVMSISFYILAGTNKRDLKSNEAAMKYFLMGAFASGVLLMGIALIYGASGSFYIADISRYAQIKGGDIIFQVGMVLILISMLFKVGAVPFHFWSPDVYEGSPVLVTSFMSTLGKVASFAAIYKLFSTCFLGSKDLYEFVLIASIVATITVANFSALRQDSMRRLLAFSGIVNAGYMLMAILLVSFDGNPSSLFYFSLAYILSSFAVFSTVLYVFEATGKDDIESFRGLAKSSPVLAAILVIGLLSMAGLPPFAGFLAKYYLFSQAINMGYVWLTLFAIVFSAVSVYYYLKVAFVLFSHSENTFEKPSKIYLFVGVIAVVFLILAGILPDFFLI